MDVDLLVQQLGLVFPQHEQQTLRNCVHERLLLMPDELDAAVVLDACINWMLDHPEGREDDVMEENQVDVQVIDARASSQLTAEVEGAKVVAAAESHPVVDTPAPQLTTNEIIDDVLSLFPDAQPEFVRQLVMTQTSDCANSVCNYLLEHRDYPKVETSVKKAQPVSKGNAVNYFENFSAPMAAPAREQALQLLYNKFRNISKTDILQVAAFYNFHYAPTRKYLSEVLLAGGAVAYTADSVLNSPPVKVSDILSAPALFVRVSSPSSQSSSISPVPTSNTLPAKLQIQLRKLGRPRKEIQLSATTLHPDLEKEVKFYEDFKRKKREERDTQMAREKAEKESRELGQMFECGCCFGEVIFEDLVQCAEGHLFCCECMRLYAKEAAFGQGKASLACMSEGCEKNFLYDQLRKALPSDVLEKYEERVTEENLSLAEMPGLVRCPNCNYAAVMSPDDKVFRCQNSECLMKTCRYCKEEWSEHFGKPCNEVEKQSDLKFRLTIEEQMTEAKIRRCPKCNTQFFKEEGCNKMTCRCQCTMCYICRQFKIDYNHFCQHVRDPGKGCTKCTKCSLWTNQQQDDDMAIKEIRRKACEKHKAVMKTESRDFNIKIGVDLEPPAKRVKKSKRQANRNNPN
ncbi:E3 ubiquitin-protein ligase RNF216-like [Corticium candelabrum]|uniref:E3 ubiquitin-protein ligase RNF216-like n=1 Tax=Corticium candelabrum TaxID=121492 RepID=UPI002E31E065|nr:E3 ubiquitin-protein ligase RNF216-like [Corticium candelabrum]